MDKYDIQIAGLNKLSGNEFKKEAIYQWENAEGLFDYAHREEPDPSAGRNPDVGCLTMIKRSIHYKAFSPDGSINTILTYKIHNDKRIPTGIESIEKKHLNVFAEYQREIDKLWGIKY